MRPCRVQDLPAAARQCIPVAGPVSIRRDGAGRVTLTCPTPGAGIRFLTNPIDPQSDPTESGKLYDGPFPFLQGRVQAVATGPGLISGAVFEESFPRLVDRTNWKVVFADSEHPGEGEAVNAIDGDPDTYWHTKWGPGAAKHPHEIRIDLGDTLELEGFTYLPRQNSRNGRIARYEVHVGLDKKTWSGPVHQGVFPDTARLQKVLFAKPVRARYLRLVAKSEVRGRLWTSVAEIGVLAVKKVK